MSAASARALTALSAALLLGAAPRAQVGGETAIVATDDGSKAQEAARFLAAAFGALENASFQPPAATVLPPLVLVGAGAAAISAVVTTGLAVTAGIGEAIVQNKHIDGKVREVWLQANRGR